MERIQIGRGPDFCMLRGPTVINYRVKITGVYNQVEFKLRVVVDPSLAMVLKKIRQNLPVVINDLILVAEGKHDKDHYFILNSQDRKSHFQVKLYLPADLLKPQQSKIIDFIKEQFNSRL